LAADYDRLAETASPTTANEGEPRQYSKLEDRMVARPASGFFIERVLTSGQVSQAAVGSVQPPSVSPQVHRQYREADRKRGEKFVLRAQKNAQAVTDF
jgi:hypothetical protein